MKRAYSTAEKSLFVAPLLILLTVFGLWLWRRTFPFSVEIDSSDLTEMSISPDGKRLVVFFSDPQTQQKHAQVFDLEGHDKVCDLEEPKVRPSNITPPVPGPWYYRSPSWSVDGTRIAAAYDDGSQGTVKVSYHSRLNPKRQSYYFNYIAKFAIWDAQSGALTGNYLYAPPTENSSSGNLRFSPDGKTLIGLGRPPSIFGAITGVRAQVIKGSFGNASKAEFSENLGLVALQSSDSRRFEVMDSKSKRILWSPHTINVESIKWSGNVLALTDFNDNESIRRRNINRLQLWDGKSQKLLPCPPIVTNGSIYDFTLSSSSGTVAYAVYNRGDARASKPMPSYHLIVWDYRQGRVKWRTSPTSFFRRPAWSPDGKWLAVVRERTKTLEQNLLIFDQNGNLRLERQVDGYATDWSPDSKQIAIFKALPDFKGRIEMVPTSSWETK